MKFLLLSTCALFTASSFVCAMAATESQVALAPQGNWAELRAQFDELLAQTTPDYFYVTCQFYDLPEPKRSEAQDYVYSKIPKIMAQAEPLSEALSSPCILPIMFACKNPLEARELIVEINQNNGLHEKAWRFLLMGTWTSDAGSKIMFEYCNLKEAEIKFIEDFPNIMKRSVESGVPKKMAPLDPWDHFVDMKVGLSQDNPHLRKTLEQYYYHKNELFIEMQQFLGNDLTEYRCFNKKDEELYQDWRRRTCCLDLDVLRNVLAMETRAHAESHDPRSIFNMVSIFQKYQEALRIKRRDFQTGRLDRHERFFQEYHPHLESEIIRCTDSDKSFTESPIEHYIDAFFHNGDQFSLSAQYKLLKKFEGTLPEPLKKYTDKNLHNLQPTSLNALIFMEEFFKLPKDIAETKLEALYARPEPKAETRQETQIALIEKPVICPETTVETRQETQIELIEKHVICPKTTIETRQEPQIALLGAPQKEPDALSKLDNLFSEKNSFKKVRAMFKEMVLDGKDTLVEAILKSEYRPLEHLVKSLYHGEDPLTPEELKLVSPFLDRILKEAPTKVSQNKKSKKNQLTPEKKARNNIYNFRAQEPIYPKTTLPTEYDHVGLEALKAKQSSVEAIKNMTPTLGLEYLEGNNKIKVRAYFVNGNLVDQKTYRNAHEQKQLHTIGTHLPHGGRTLDKTFQAELYGMIDQIFGLSQPKK